MAPFERALELMCERASSRGTFGRELAANANIQDWIADARIQLEMARLLTPKAAWLMDTVGNKQARMEIAATKVAAPRTTLNRGSSAPGSRHRRRHRGPSACSFVRPFEDSSSG